jgi:UrcA family protein
MKESKLVKGIVAIIVVAAFGAPAFASADAGFKGRAEKVSYSDLNVEKEEGAETLYRRLQQASRRVCGVESIRSVRGAKIESEQRSCYQQALEEAVAEIDSEALNAVHEG